MAGLTHEQARHDSYQSGTGPVDPTEAWTLGFWWNGPDSAGGKGSHAYTAPIEARTVCGAGNVYIPAGSSGLYAIALSSTGFTPTAAWHSTAATFRATPVYDLETGAVFAGGADGVLYKFDAATGTQLGTYTAGGGALRKDLLLVGHYIYVVGFDGKLHKVHKGTLVAAWVYTPTLVTVTNPISGMGHGSTPPAYSPSRDTLYYCTDDCYVHCVSNSTGVNKWRVKPSTLTAGGVPNAANWDGGVTFERGWPVVADRHGYVLVRLQIPGSPYLQAVPTGFAHDIAWTDQGSIQTFLAANPTYQNLFVLSLDTGTAASFTPAVLAGYMEGQFATSLGTATGFSQSGTTLTVTLSNPSLSATTAVQFSGWSPAAANGVWNVTGTSSSTQFSVGLPSGVTVTATGTVTYLSGQVAQMPSLPLVKVWPNGDEVVYIQFRQGAQVTALGNITSIVGNGTTATVTVPSTSGIGSVGTTPYQPVIIQGATPSGFNTIQQATIVDSTHFTIPSTVNATASVPGTYGLSPLDWRWDGHIGEMVLDSTTVSGLPPGQLRFMQFERQYYQSAGAESYSFINDEQSPYSLMGSTLLRSHFSAMEGSTLTDRTAAHGLTCADPMPMTHGKKTVVWIQSDAATGSPGYVPSTHLTTDGLTNGQFIGETGSDGRFWDGPGYWQYWQNQVGTPGPGNYMPSGEVGPETFLFPNWAYGPRDAYVHNQYVIVEGSAGEIGVFTHSASVPSSSAGGLTILT